MNITIDKLEKDYQKAKDELEEAEIDLTYKKNEFYEIQQKRNNRLCKELKKLLSHFYMSMTKSDLFYQAFEELDTLGADCEEILFEDFDSVTIQDETFYATQTHTVEYDKYEHKIKIPETISLKKIEEIFEKYLEKGREVLRQEEITKRNQRYQQYLKLKEEFEKDESPH